LSTSSEPHVSSFLQEFKLIATSSNGPWLENRAARNPSVLTLGLTIKTVKLEILGLSVVDYSSGPVPDRDRPGDLWIFGKEINGHEIYIKLKIATIANNKIAKCISFHEAEFPLNYPFK
jgi:hypothetical protein